MSPHTDADLKEALTSVQRIVNADPRDWGADRHDAFLYGLFHGWDPAGEPTVADRHGWDADFLSRLHRLHDAVATALD